MRHRRMSYTYRQKRPSNYVADHTDKRLVPISRSPVHRWLCWFDTNGTSAEMNLCRTPTDDPVTAAPGFLYNFGRIPMVKVNEKRKLENVWIWFNRATWVTWAMILPKKGWYVYLFVILTGKKFSNMWRPGGVPGQLWSNGRNGSMEKIIRKNFEVMQQFSTRSYGRITYGIHAHIDMCYNTWRAFLFNIFICLFST